MRTIIDAIKNLIGKIKGIFSEKTVKMQELQRTSDLFEQALNDAANEKNVDGGERKYSPIETNAKGKYVQADRQVINGDNAAEWEGQIYNYINDKIRNGQDVVIPTDDGDNLTISEKTAWKMGYRNTFNNGNEKQQISDDLYRTKLNAAAHIDELAEISNRGKKNVADTKNHDFAQDGFNYRTAYFRDLDGQYYRLTISVGENSEQKTIYNIGQIKRVPFPDIDAQRQRSVAAPSAKRNSSTDIISNPEKNVKHSLKENTSNLQTKSDTNTQEKNGDDAIQGGSDNVLNEQDVKDMQSIGRKSINDFSSEDIEKTKNVAKKYYAEMGNKSPFFRSWFGDWRENDTTPVHIVTEKDNARGVKVNKDTGWNIQISGKVFNETQKHIGTKNQGGSQYLDYINPIVENAILIDSYSMGNVKSPNSVMMHSFYALANNEKGIDLVKMYVEEMRNPNSDKTSKRSYQLQKINKIPLTGTEFSQNDLALLKQRYTYTVSDLFNLVKKYDKNFKPQQASKVVNEDGTPKVVYHGGYQKFTVFGDGNKTSNAPNGSHFFTDDIDVAYSYS